MQTTAVHSCRSDHGNFCTTWHNRVFNWVYQRNLIYNTCWEDPAVDHQALLLRSDDVVAMITSAGCNALDYALAGPRAVHTVDANPKQTAVLELKQAAIRRLDHGDFFRLFGLGVHPGFRGLYRRCLRRELTPVSRLFWDERVNWFDRKGGGFYYRGLSGRFARAFRVYMSYRPRLQRGLRHLARARDLAHQRRIYLTEVEPFIWTPSLRWLMNRQVTMSILGVPASQREEVNIEHAGGVAGFVAACIDRVATSLPFGDNYFWNVYVNGHYTQTCCPNYLKPEFFRQLKAGLVDIVHPGTMTVHRLLSDPPDRFSRFVLLDHMDWMSHHDPKALAEEWSLLVGSARPGARIIFRSAASRPAYLDAITFAHAGRCWRLDQACAFRTGLADRLHPYDRVGTYGGFHIADLRPAVHAG